MIYKPSKGQLWDVWVFHNDGRYYLFYDVVPEHAITAIGLATSEDGVHWKEHGIVIAKPEKAWGIGSGFTWRSPKFKEGGNFQCNFSIDQRIYFAESPDLFDGQERPL